MKKLLILLAVLLLITPLVSAIIDLENSDDETIIKYAFQNADASVCEYIEGQVARQDCLQAVSDKFYLKRSSAELEKVSENASVLDKQLLSKALISDNASFCSNIRDVSTKNYCFSQIIRDSFLPQNLDLEKEKGFNPFVIYSLLIVIILVLLLIFLDLEKRRRDNFVCNHEQLIRYISLEIKKGFSEEKIIANLKRVGWKSDIIKKGLKDAKRRKR